MCEKGESADLSTDVRRLDNPIQDLFKPFYLTYFGNENVLEALHMVLGVEGKAEAMNFFPLP